MPSNTYNVLDAIFSDPFGYTEETRWFQEFASIGDGELSTFHSHSLAVIIAQKWEQLSSQYSYEWEYNLDTGQVLVLPAPQVEGKMVLKIAYKRELKEMPTSLEQPLQDLALAECLQLTAVSSSDGIMSLPIGIGNVTFDNTKLLARADILRKRGLQKLGVHSGEGVVIIG